MGDGSESCRTLEPAQSEDGRRSGVRPDRQGTDISWRTIEFVPYTMPSEISLAARNYGFNNFFMIIDDAAYGPGPRQADLRREVEAILGPSDLVEGLFTDATINQRPSTRIHTRPGLAIDAAVSLIPPAMDRKKLVSTIHVLHYIGHAAAPTMVEPEQFLSAIFEPAIGADGPENQLSAFGKAFFTVLADTKVAPGARPEDFGPCAN